MRFFGNIWVLFSIYIIYANIPIVKWVVEKVDSGQWTGKVGSFASFDY